MILNNNKRNANVSTLFESRFSIIFLIFLKHLQLIYNKLKFQDCKILGLPRIYET